MKDNKLIAEFMGLDTEVFNSGKVNYYYYDKISKQEIFLEAHELSYNVSWDWLMPVLLKCRQENQLKYFERVYYALEECDINVAYKAVIEFIKTKTSRNYGRK